MRMPLSLTAHRYRSLISRVSEGRARKTYYCKLARPALPPQESQLRLLFAYLFLDFDHFGYATMIHIIAASVVFVHGKLKGPTDVRFLRGSILPSSEEPGPERLLADTAEQEYATHQKNPQQRHLSSTSGAQLATEASSDLFAACRPAVFFFIGASPRRKGGGVSSPANRCSFLWKAPLLSSDFVFVFPKYEAVGLLSYKKKNDSFIL